MVPVPKDDVLRALKKFRRLAKQDLLASEHTPRPEFWRRQAEARRETYAVLIESVSERGVDAAYRGREGLAGLPLFREGQDPAVDGAAQAFELFFRLVGVDEKELTRMRNSRRRRRASGEERPFRRESSQAVGAGV